MLLMRVAYVEKTTPSLKSVGSPSTLQDTCNVSFDAPLLSFMFRYVPCLSVQLLAAINDFYVTSNIPKVPGKEEGRGGGRENGRGGSRDKEGEKKKGREGRMEERGREEGEGRGGRRGEEEHKQPILPLSSSHTHLSASILRSCDTLNQMCLDSPRA